MNAKKIGSALKEVLKQSGESPNWLAEKTGIGVRTLYSILNGHHSPSVEKLYLICQVLRVSMDEIFSMDFNAMPLFAAPYQESQTYAQFEDRHFGSGGERISVSRSLSIVNQSEELRECILRNVYNQSEEQTELTMNGFRERLHVIKQKERSRLEIVVQSEVIDFIYQRGPYDAIPGPLISDCIEGVIDRLQNDPLSFELLFIPRQFFLVNYEIINRNVILFDMGTLFMRQTNERVIKHFLKEVEAMKTRLSIMYDRNEVISYLEHHLRLAKVTRA